MQKPNRRSHGLRRFAARGFSLMELGIVVAVIAILATVVLSGKGFLQSSRLNKMVELIDTISKACSVYAGINGGKLPPSPPAPPLLDELNDRRLIPASVKATGKTVNSFQIMSLTRVTQERWQIVINCLNGAAATQDCAELEAAEAKNEMRLSTVNGGTSVTFEFSL